MISIPGKIPLRFYPLFWVIAGLIGWLNSMTVLGTALWVVVIVVSLLVHECGHAFTAVFFGQRAEISFVAMGGLTTRKGPKLPLWKEFLIVLNGPIAGFCLALVALFLQNLLAPVKGTVLAYILTISVWANIAWTILNLIPIQPMDGGRLLSIILESLFGIKGIKWSLFISMVLAAVLGLFFIITHNLFIGAILFIFAFENYRSWQASLDFNEQDQSIALQHMLKAAEQEMRSGRTQEALDKYMRIREMTPKGLIYQTATQQAALLLSQMGRYAEAYQLLSPIRKNLSADTLRLLHHLAYDSGLWQEIIRTSNEVFQLNPDYDTALVNAYAFARVGDVQPAVGWLQCALREGLPNLREVIKRSDFDSIRDDQEFEKLLNH